jgi:hypothetical protein
MRGRLKALEACTCGVPGCTRYPHRAPALERYEPLEIADLDRQLIRELAHVREQLSRAEASAREWFDRAQDWRKRCGGARARPAARFKWVQKLMDSADDSVIAWTVGGGNGDTDSVDLVAVRPSLVEAWLA